MHMKHTGAGWKIISRMNQKIVYFKDGNGFVDISNRVIGRWTWNDNQPFAQWKVDWAWCWTATDLYGLNDDEWETMFVLSTPNPNARTVEQRIADDLYWKKTAPFAWHTTRKIREMLPKRNRDYTIKL